MLIAMRNALMAGKRLSAKSYVQDGLVAMWDGIENAGFGTHDDSATVWKDLSGSGYDATHNSVATGWQWGSDCYIGTSQNGHAFVVPTGFTTWLQEKVNSHTIEVVFMPSANSRMVPFGQFGSNGGLDFESTSSRGARLYYSGRPNWSDQMAWNFFNLATARALTVTAISSESSISLRVANQDRAAQNTPVAADTVTNNDFRLGGEPARTSMSIIGNLYHVRVYSRALTDAELLSNHIVDHKRFNTVLTGGVLL